MESDKSPINDTASDEKRGISESQPLLDNSDEKKKYDAITDETPDGKLATGPDGDLGVDQKFKGQFKRAQSRYLTVEIPVALTALVFQLLNTLETEYIHERISENHNYTPPENGSCDSYNETGSIGAEIQSETSLWMFYLGMAYALPNLFCAVFIGSMSDRYGRKPALFSTSFGFLCRSILFLFIVLFHLPIPVFIAADFLGGVFGGNSILMSAGAAYISDLTTEKNRTFRLIIFELSANVGVGIGQIVLGLTLENSTYTSYYKYLLPVCLCIGCTAGALLYFIIPTLVIESVNVNSNHDKAGLGMVLTGIVDIVKVNTNGRRTKLIINCLIMVFAEIVILSQMRILIVYALGYPFCLTPLYISYLLFIGISIPLLGFLIGGVAFSRIFSDNWILQISFLNNIVFLLLVGFAETLVLLFIGTASGLFIALFYPILRSKLSKLAGENEMGLMLTFIGCMDSIAYFLVPVVSNTVYSATVYFFPPFVFFLLAGLEIIPIGFTGILQCMDRKKNFYKNIEETEETKI